MARELAALDARRTALELLQKQVSRSGEMHAWLDDHQLDGLGRLWQGLRIEPGWEDALEAILRERLNGIAVDDLERAKNWLQHPPPGRSHSSSSRRIRPRRCRGTAQADCVHHLDRSWRARGVERRLERVYVAARCGRGFAQTHELAAGELLVCPQGYVFTRNSVSFHAVDSEIHGILSRQREIELERARHGWSSAPRRRARRWVEAQAELEHARQSFQRLRQESETVQQQRHDLQIEQLRLSQLAERVGHRHAPRLLPS